MTLIVMKMMLIDYSLSRADPLGAIHEPTYYNGLEIYKGLARSKRIYTGIQITYPKNYPYYALRNVRIWYSLDYLNEKI